MLASSAAIAQQPAKATADEVYQHRYTTAGYLRRAGAVCQNDSKRTIDAANGLVSGDGMKAFSKSFPRKTKTWMAEGTEVFVPETEVARLNCEAARSTAYFLNFDQNQNATILHD